MTRKNGDFTDITDSKFQQGLNGSRLYTRQQLLEDIRNYKPNQNNNIENQINELTINVTNSPQTISPNVSNFPSGQCSPKNSTSFLGPRSYTNTDNCLLKAYENNTHNDRFVNQFNLPDNLSFANEKTYNDENQSYTNMKINTEINKKIEPMEDRKTTVCCVCNNSITR